MLLSLFLYPPNGSNLVALCLPLLSYQLTETVQTDCKHSVGQVLSQVTHRSGTSCLSKPSLLLSTDALSPNSSQPDLVPRFLQEPPSSSPSLNLVPLQFMLLRANGQLIKMQICVRPSMASQCFWDRIQILPLVRGALAWPPAAHSSRPFCMPM